MRKVFFATAALIATAGIAAADISNYTGPGAAMDKVYVVALTDHVDDTNLINDVVEFAGADVETMICADACEKEAANGAVVVEPEVVLTADAALEIEVLAPRAMPNVLAYHSPGDIVDDKAKKTQDVSIAWTEAGEAPASIVPLDVFASSSSAPLTSLSPGSAEAPLRVEANLVLGGTGVMGSSLNQAFSANA